MKRSLLILTLCFLTVAWPLDVVLAQELDIDALAEDVLTIAPGDLLELLAEPPSQTVLPSPFVAPPSGEVEGTDVVNAFAQYMDRLETGSAVTHGVEIDQSLLDHSLGAGVLSWVVIDEEITAQEFAAFPAELEGLFSPAPESSSASVAGVDAWFIRSTEHRDEFYIDVVTYVIAIGNVYVTGTVIVGDTRSFDQEQLAAHAEELTLAGAAWLAEIVDHAGEPGENDPLNDKFGSLTIDRRVIAPESQHS